jgi:predicted AlkP superfamily phosphohydrolase/phosphomutase
MVAMQTSERLLLIGLDGATWTVLDPMRKRGLMPNLDALLARSAYGTLRSTIPPMTSAAWTTMMTGCGPARHGVFDHRYFDIGANRMRVNHAGRVRVPTFWQLLSQAGHTVVSLNVPVTYPPSQVRGVMVSGIDAPHIDAALSGSAAFGKRIKEEVPGYHIRALWKRPPQTVEEMNANAQATTELGRARVHAANIADEMNPNWSALMVQFQNLDPFQHRAWRYLNVDETGIEDAGMNAGAEEVFRGLDEAIGGLCELADRRGAGVMVMSDHGFGPCLGRIHANRILVDAGVASLPGVAGRLRRRVRQGIDHLRTFQAKRSDPEARSATFEHSIAAQYPFNWKKTLAFIPHQDTAAMVYLNSASRKPGAPLETPRQVEDALNATIQALGEARHPETGVLLFPQIVNVSEAYGVDTARENYPDIVALPDENYWVRTKLAKGTAWVEADDNLPGTHRPEGIVAVSGAGVVPGRNLKAHLNDVMPSVMKWFRLPIPAHVEGKPLPCLGSLPTIRQDSGASPIAGPHKPDFEYSEEEQRLIEQRLADLGYLA